jgi:hypothetical protein
MTNKHGTSIQFGIIGEHFDGQPLYGFILRSYGIFKSEYPWTKDGLKAALKRAKHFSPSN